MRSSGFWRPFIISLIATPLCLFLGLASAGAGHGDYHLATILFPYSVFLIFFFGGWLPPALTITNAIAQFPLYGIILGVASVKKRFRIWAVWLLAIHILAAIATFILRSQRDFL